MSGIGGIMKTSKLGESPKVSEAILKLLKGRGTLMVSALLMAFGYLAAITQFFDEDSQFYGVTSLSQFALKTHQIAGSTNIVEFDQKSNPFDGACRRLDIALPPGARIYMDDMLGPTNLNRTLMYASVAYYLFPRDIETSLDQPALITREGYAGRAAEYTQELVTNGFDVELSARSNEIKGRPLRPDLPLRPLTTPDWFHSTQDRAIAFVLPLMTSLSGLWLAGFLFPQLFPSLGFLEKLACSLGLGMMAVAALTLGIKLMGFHGDGLVLLITGVGTIAVCWKYRKTKSNWTLDGLREVAGNPALLVAVLFFCVVFYAAGTLGLVESDAVAAWMLKAKIFHLHVGREIVHWFSEPRLAHAHLDYPTLIPSLHAATFDSIGQVDEYVTKFWPAWMLLMLVGAVASVNRRSGRLAFGVSFFLLSLVLLPSTREYVEMEGSTIPMVFFTAVGLLQCTLGMSEENGSRIGLGLMLLFGGAVAKFEGIITLAAALIWLLVFPQSRRLISMGKRFWWIVGSCALATLPFCVLRAQIPALHYESGWAGFILAHPLDTLSNLPSFLLMMTARWFMSPTFADWTVANGSLRWAGHWEGLSSLYNHPTLGLTWVTLAITVAVWVKNPLHRKPIVWLLVVVGTLLLAFSAVFSGFVSTMGRSYAFEYYTAEIASGRYLFPVLVAWSTIAVTFTYRCEMRLRVAVGAGVSFCG